MSTRKPGALSEKDHVRWLGAIFRPINEVMAYPFPKCGSLGCNAKCSFQVKAPRSVRGSGNEYTVRYLCRACYAELKFELDLIVKETETRAKST